LETLGTKTIAEILHYYNKKKKRRRKNRGVAFWVKMIFVFGLMWMKIERANLFPFTFSCDSEYEGTKHIEPIP
jgi:hypothetical protein